MKFSTAFFALLLSLSSSADGAFSPTRISLESLLKGEANQQFLEAFQDVGMVSITDIPLFESKIKALAELPRCMDESSEHAMALDLPDGTRRRTLATHSVGCKKVSPLSVANHVNCDEFKESSQNFREVVALVVETFGELLASTLNLDASKPVLFDEANNGYSLNEVFAFGDHLEHFHAYQKVASSNGNDDTIEWHLDQGLALVFTPGLVEGETVDGFYIRLADGSSEMVDFQPTDDLVVLLGDGVNQYINRALDPEQRPLRAVPHAFRMPDTTSPRVWYGRMVLPPAEALHPLHSITFGDIREGMLAEDVVSSEFGCSHDMVARELQDTTCEGDSFYCWHRCMNYTDYNISAAMCEDEDLDLACVNEDGALWDGSHNPDFALGCVDLTIAKNYTDYNETDAPETDAPETDAPETDSPTDAPEDGVNRVGAIVGMAIVAASTLAAVLSV